MCHYKKIWFGLIILQGLLVATQSQNILLEIQLQQYTRSGGDVIRFCLYNDNDDNADNSEFNVCSAGNATVIIDAGGNRSFEIGDILNVNSNIMNPLSFEVSMGDYQLCIRINGTPIAKAKRVIQVSAMTIGSNMSASITCTVNTTRLEYSYLVRCAPNYFGSNCSTSCTPMDNITGHFTCGSNGEIMCLPGYTNTTSQSNETEGLCTVCVSPTCQENGNEGGRLSGGGVAGLVVTFLIIGLLVAVGAIVGMLLWKYQPWDDKTKKIQANGVLSNPVYEVVSDKATNNSSDIASNQAKKNRSTESIDSNPLYNTHGDTLRPSPAFVDNQTLVNVLHASTSSIPRLDSPTKVNLHNETGSDPHLEDDNPSTEPAAVVIHLDPYASYKDAFLETNSQDIEESNIDEVEFDNPDYGTVNF